MVHTSISSTRASSTPLPVRDPGAQRALVLARLAAGRPGLQLARQDLDPDQLYGLHGLRRYGYHQLATLVAQETHRLVIIAGNREYYDAETSEGCGLDPFWGWSLLGHFMPYEETIQADITEVG